MLGVPHELPSWPAVGISLLVAIVGGAIRTKYLSPISDIPGPFLASFTRMWHIIRIAAGDQNLRLTELHDKHGHFVRISHDEVSVTHPDAVKKLYLNPVPKGYWYKGTALPDYRFEAPMAILNPKPKIELSRVLSPPYSQTNVLQYEPAIDNIINLLQKWMDKYAQNGEAMRLDDYFAYVTFDVVGEVVFARPFGFLERGYDIDNSIANSEMLSAFTAFTSFYRTLRNIFLTNPFMTWLQILPMGHVFNTTMAAIKEREKNVDKQSNPVVVDHWFKTHRENPQRLTMRNIYAQATNNVGAGADTVNSCLQTFFYHLLKHPAALAKATKEVDEAVRQGRCTTEVVSFADAQELHYVQACIKEALRVFHPVPMGLPRTVPEGGITIGERTFAKGTILSVTPWVLHRSPEIWGPDAREFVPERWFREGAAELERKYYMAFGAGYASCPGHNIAKMELSKITATILRDYKLRLVDEKKEWRWRANFTVVAHDWPVYVQRRARDGV